MHYFLYEGYDGERNWLSAGFPSATAAKAAADHFHREVNQGTEPVPPLHWQVQDMFEIAHVDFGDGLQLTVRVFSADRDAD